MYLYIIILVISRMSLMHRFLVSDLNHLIFLVFWYFYLSYLNLLFINFLRYLFLFLLSCSRIYSSCPTLPIESLIHRLSPCICWWNRLRLVRLSCFCSINRLWSTIWSVIAGSSIVRILSLIRRLPCVWILSELRRFISVIS